MFPFFSECLLLDSLMKIIALLKVCPYICVHSIGLRVSTGQGQDLLVWVSPGFSQGLSVSPGNELARIQV